jgi:chemotaxis protein methyltransferase CheR
MDQIWEVADLVRREAGIVLPRSRETALRSALRRALPDIDAGGFLREAADPARGPALVGRLVDEITTQETEFARDRGQFDDIDWHALLRQCRTAGDTAIRVWSAGCATGEEPYTLAILAAEAFSPASAPVDILGTDISEAALRAGRAARYRPRAVRLLPGVLRARYLDRSDDGAYQVTGRLRRLVRFRRHNLVREPIPPPDEAPFDLIVCRNVLIYFEPPQAKRLIGAFENATRRDGRLILGAVDALCREQPTPRARPAMTLGPAATPGQTPVQPRREERLAASLAAAGRGDYGEARARASRLLEDDPLDAEANFVSGLVSLSAGDPAQAVAALRGALYSEGTFALAAFTLGRAYDVMGDCAAARRAYQRAMLALAADGERHEFLLQQVDVGDIAEACRTRLGETHEDSRRG